MGKERCNLACGLARLQFFLRRNPWHEVFACCCCLLLLLVVTCSYYGEGCSNTLGISWMVRQRDQGKELIQVGGPAACERLFIGLSTLDVTQSPLAER